MYIHEDLSNVTSINHQLYLVTGEKPPDKSPPVKS